VGTPSVGGGACDGHHKMSDFSAQSSPFAGS
jgi:hypothetical protein